MHRLTSLFRIAVSCFFFLAADAALASSFVCTSIASGNWGTSTTWNCPGAPGGYTPISLDTVNVTGGFTVTVEANHDAATINVGDGTTSGTLNFLIGVTVNVGGNVTVQNGSASDSELFVNNGALNVTGTTQISGGSSNFGSLRVNAGNVSLVGDVSFIGTSPANQRLLISGNGQISITGNLGGNGSLSSASGTYAFVGAANTTINGAYSYYDFVVSKTSPAYCILAQPATINNDLAIFGGVFSDGGNQVTGNGTGTFTISGATSEMQVLAAFPTNYVNFNLSSNSTLSYRASGAQTVAAISYGQLLILGSGTKTAAGNVTANGYLLISTPASLDMSTYALTANDNIIGDGNLTTAGDVVIGGSYSNSGTFTQSNALKSVTYNGTSNATMKATTYNNVFISGSGTKAVGGATTINGNIVMNAGSSFDASVSDVSVGGDWHQNSAAAFNAGSKRVTLTGSGIITQSNFYDLTINGNYTATGNIDAANDFVVGVAATFDAGSYTHAVGGNLNIQTANNFNANSSTFDMKGTGSGNIVGAAQTFSNLTFSGSGTKTLANNETINGTLLISNNLSVSPVSITLVGDLTNNGAFTAGGSTFKFNSTGNQTIGGSSSTAFDNLIVNKPATTLILNALTSVSTSLTLTDGIVSGPSKLAVGTSGNITRTNGWVSAPLQIAFPGGGMKTFPVGTTTYGPVDITVFMAGNVVVTPFSGLPPNLTGTNALTRYWTITGISVTNATFFYQAADVNGGTEANYVAARYSSPDWQRVATTINTGVHSAAVGAFGSNSGTWAIGEPATLGLGVVTNTNDSGLGSLRQAIIDTNANTGADTISFNIAPSGAHTITFSSAPPDITGAVVIDGSTQPGFSGSPIITLSGASITAGLKLTGGNSTIKAMATELFVNGSASIWLASSNNLVTSCWIGVNDGTWNGSSGNLGDGILITGANNVVGGTTVATRNVISGNQGYGVSIAGAAATGNAVQGNYIGPDASGIAGFANSAGLSIRLGATNNTVGGTAAGAGNVISSNAGAGIVLFDSGTSSNLIQGNIIGLDATGSSLLSNSGNGISITDIGGGAATGNTIGGGTTAARNVVSANNGDGIRIETNGNTVQNNYVGTDAAGTGAQFNVGVGIRASAAGLGNKIVDNKVRSGVQKAIVVAGGAYGTWILDNLIQTTSGRQIDLNDDGADTNDTGDVDMGTANNGQNYPVISNAIYSGGNLDLYFSVDSSASMNAGGLGIEIFKSDSLGNTSQLITSQCLGATLTYSNYKVTAAATLTPGSDYVTATITNYNNAGCTTSNDGTSELAPVKLVSAAVACQVINTNDSGSGSLRQAILDANAGGCTFVTFNIPGGGAQTIQPLSALPTITRVYILDGRSEPGYGGTPIITLDGSSAGAMVNGLTTSLASGAGSQIRGFVIRNFSGHGIEINNPSNGGTTVLGNYIGTNGAGTAAQGNGGYGIHVTNGTGCFIGSAAAGDRNVISGNTQGGIRLDATSASVQNNYIGTNAAGTAAIPNLGAGVTITNSTNGVGGTSAGQRNIISGNGSSGILLSGANAFAAVIPGNYIGVDVNGTAALGNGADGITIVSGAHGNNIGNASLGNVISGNAGNGIAINGTAANSNVIQNNTIGLDASKSVAIGNALHGVIVQGGAQANVIASTANVISGNGGNGVTLSGSGTNGNLVKLNFIGTDGSGTAARPNALAGVYADSGAQLNTISTNLISGNTKEGVYLNGSSLNSVMQNVIGIRNGGGSALGNGLSGVRIAGGAVANNIGSSTGRNFISGNFEGISIEGAGTNGNFVAGNSIGVDLNNTTPIPNAHNGIAIHLGAQNNVAGGVAAANANLIAYNGENGVAVFDSGTTGNQILGNSIHHNTLLAIDLGNDGATANDAGDVDTNNGNNLQNWPTFVDAYLTDTQLVAHLTGNALAATGSIRLETFKADTSLANPQAAGILGTQCIAGNSFSAFAPSLTATGITPGTKLIATSTSYSDTSCATASDGTSELSNAATVTCLPPAPVVNAGGPTTFCSGGSVTLSTTASGTYQWSLNGNPIMGANAASYNATASGTYMLTVTYPTTCSASTPTTVTVTPLPNATISVPSTVNAGSVGNSASVASGPAGTTYVWTIGNGTITAGAGTRAITFTAGSSGVVTLGVTVTSGPSCSATGSATVAIASQADLALVVSGPSTANGGDPLTYAITVANNGPSQATNLSVLMAISGGASATSASGAGFTCSVSATAVTCNGAALAVGGSRTITLITTSPQSDATIKISASVTASTTDPSPANNSASATTNVGIQCPANGGPSLIAPADGATNVGSPVTFSWVNVANATSYEVWASSGNASPVIVATTTSSPAVVSMSAGRVSWYVIARFGANCTPQPSLVRTFTVPPQSSCDQHQAPQLTAPANGASATLPVTFSWQSVSGAIDYRLWLTVDDSAPQDLGVTAGKTTFTTPLAGTKFTWYVDAIFDGCPPTRSATSGFTIPMIDPCADRGTTTILSPAEAAALTSAIVPFKWASVAGASGYRVWIAVDGGEFQTLGTATSATTLDAAVPAGNAEFYVETLFDGCASTESAHAHFSTPHAQQCGNAKPQLFAPANGATLNNPIVDFAWEGVPNGLAYEVWLSLNGGTPALVGTTTSATLRHEVAAGSLRWFVRARVNGCPDSDSVNSTFTYVPPANCTTQRPLIVAPADNAAAYSPLELSWSSVPGAAQYRVWSARNSEEPSILTTTATNHITQTMQPGTYHLFVEALFTSCPIARSATINVNVLPLPPTCAPPEAPVIRAASEASSGIEYTVRWNQIANASFYELQEAHAADFSDATTLPAFTTEAKFRRTNDSGAAVVVRYRVRTVSKCESQRSLYSDEVDVVILPSNTAASSQVNQATPAEDPQKVTYTFEVTGAAGQAFSALSTQPWLTVTPVQGTIPQSGVATLTAHADTSGLPVGANTASVQVTLGALSKGSAAASATASTSTTTVSINLTQPVSPTPKSTPPPDALIIPAVAHAQGITSQFESDVRISNTSPQLMKYQLTFTPTGEDGIKEGRQTTIEIDPGTTIALDDVLRSWFGTNEGGTGTLEVRPLTAATASTAASAKSGLSNLVTFASSRLFSNTASGTFGQFIPAIPFANFAGKGSTLTLPQIAQSAAFRTNLGLVEGSGEPAALLISVFGTSGQKLTEFTQTLNGGQHLQLNSFLAQKNVSTDNARVEVKVTSPGGKVTAYASVIDNLTSDPLLVSPINVPSGVSRYVLTGVADLSGGAANWRSDVRVLNAGSKDVSTTLTYAGGDGMTLTRPLDLKAGETKQFDSVLRSLFDLTNSGGALFIDSSGTSTLVATARTYNDTGKGTYGQYIPAVTLGDTAALGTRPLQLLQVEESSRIRTNVGFTEVAGKAATLEVTVVPPNAKVEAKVQIALAPNEFRQVSQLLKAMGLPETYNARVTVRVIDGAGRVTAYASAIDQRTQDPTYIPAQ